MNPRVTKAQTRRFRATLAKAAQAKLLDAAPDKRAELPRSHREVNGRIARDTTPVQTEKRHLDATSKSGSLPAKRTRLTPGIERAEQTDKIAQTTIQQPEPRPPKRPYASFLKEFVDPSLSHTRPESLHTFVSEWLESVGSDREERCRSDSYLHRSDDDPITRQLTRSAPETGHIQDAHGVAVPPTPASTRSYRATEDSASSIASVRHPSYRQNNLKSNGVHIRHDRTRLPDHLSNHVERLRAERNSPSPSSEQIDEYLDGLGTLAEGCTEAEVEEFLKDMLFPKSLDLTYGRPAGLGSAQSSLVSSHLIPNNPESQFRVTQPKPDLLYGYSGNLRHGAFTQPQFLAQEVLHPRNARYAEATTQGLRFPFFAIEFKAAGGTRGDLWVATNQCAGASAACLNAIDQLNASLREYRSAQRIDNFAYCISIDNNIAQLFISWKEGDLNYYLQRVDAFLLSSAEHFVKFRSQVRNILDWGKEARLRQIRNALDIILEENRKSAPEAAKSRQPPSNSSRASSKRRSSSRRNCSRSDDAQAQRRAGDGPYLALDETAS